jgi:hypothetical protein
MVNLEKENLYFLGYFKAIGQYSREGMTHDELKMSFRTRNYVDQQPLRRFREDSFFRLELELIPDVLLEILPVWSEQGGKDGKGGLVHHGGQLREFLVEYDPHERVRFPVNRENLSKHLSLGIEKVSKDASEIGCENSDSVSVEENERSIDTIGRETILNDHLEKEVRWNSIESRIVKTTSVCVQRDKLPKPIFTKVFSRQYTRDDHEYKLQTERRYEKHPKFLRQSLQLAGLDRIEDDPEYQNFKYHQCEEDENDSGVECEQDDNDAFRQTKSKLSDTTNKARGIVQIDEFWRSMVFVSGAVLLRATRTHIDEENMTAGPLSYRPVGSKLQMYPTKSPNIILDMGRLCLRNERIRELSDSGEDVQEFKIDDTLLLESTVFHEYCFKSLFLTFSRRPSVISNYFQECKKLRVIIFQGLMTYQIFYQTLPRTRKMVPPTVVYSISSGLFAPSLTH